MSRGYLEDICGDESCFFDKKVQTKRFNSVVDQWEYDITTALYGIKGVEFVYVSLNQEFIADYERALPSLSIRITVKGGKKKDIANVIWLYKPIGYATVGNKKVKIKDSQDYEHDIYFERIEK